MAMSREERLRRQRLNQARYDKNRTISNSERGKIYYSQNKEKVLKNFIEFYINQHKTKQN